ncbi:MAG: YbaB/EbfC family nucleoid-associated protein [Actinobacteria bacterium]|nr:YbaB/EbfC family nucleoid-associated protein [Actinomycetota bacterium]MBV8960766.1 YbaB/EbfC family nucleoid-associated protein [Actinomycetota bacterium]MBV9935843.1 YbaB/EbfC family nucleoid-associated protein [Actinomycetota bacterium]
MPDLSEGFDLGGLLEQAQQMQQQLMDAQAALADEVVEGHAGGGVVKVTVTGGMEFRSVKIDKSAVDPDDVEMLEDLILAALHDASHKVQELTQQGMGQLGLGGLGGLLG